jgi:DHA2 family multidrug resistance protein-like MFS transporter
VVAGGTIGFIFVQRQRTLAHPLIELRLFRIPAFAASLATYTLGTLVAFGAYIFIAQYLQLVAGLSPWRAGLALLPSMMGFILGSALVPPLARRVPPAYLMGAGLLIAALGFGVLTTVEQTSGLLMLVIGSAVYSVGLSPVVILATDLIVGSAPVERAGAASAISETSSELGGALGIAILGSIGTAVYRSAMQQQAIPEIPPELLQAARSTLGGAVAASEQVPHQLGLELVETAREAFMRSFHLTAAISAVVSLATALLALALLRRVQAPSREPPMGTEAENAA